MSHLPPTTQYFVVGDSLSPEAELAFTEALDREAWCVVGVTMSDTDNGEAVDRLAKRVHLRKTIFVSESRRVRHLCS